MQLPDLERSLIKPPSATGSCPSPTTTCMQTRQSQLLLGEWCGNTLKNHQALDLPEAAGTIHYGRRTYSAKLGGVQNPKSVFVQLIRYFFY